MKSIFLQNPFDSTYEVVNHNLQDQEAYQLQSELLAEGKYAQIYDQDRMHLEEPENCRYCRRTIRGLQGENVENEPVLPSLSELRPTKETKEQDIEDLRPKEPNPIVKRVVKAAPVLFGVTLLAIIIILFIGPLRPLLGSLLKVGSPKDTPVAALTLTGTASPIPASPTFKPTKASTATPRPTSTATLPAETATPTLTATPNCTPVESITVDDVGKKLCVYGAVLNTEQQDSAFLIIFSNAKGAFYMVSYDRAYPELTSGTCVMFTGEIKRLINSPVMVLGASAEFLTCP